MRGTVTLSEGDASSDWPTVHVLLEGGGRMCGTEFCSIAPLINSWFGVRLCSLALDDYSMIRQKI